MALLCFDVDGTLEPGIGPIPMKELDNLADDGHVIVIVSPSPLRPKETPYQEFLSTDRKKNLLDAREAYPEGEAVYISDNEGDDTLSTTVGFSYVHPMYWEQFLSRLAAT